MNIITTIKPRWTVKSTLVIAITAVLFGAFSTAIVRAEESSDTVRPVFTVLTPNNDYISKRSFKVGVRATDNEGLAQLTVNIKDKNNSGNLGTCLNQSVNGKKAQKAHCVIDADELGEGEYYFRGNARDMAGNISNTVSQRFIIDQTGPSITVKPESVGSDGIYQEISFKLFDKYRVDKLTLNGVEKDLSDNRYSDLNFVKPGAFGAKVGKNTLVVYDVAGNATIFKFVLGIEPGTHDRLSFHNVCLLEDGGMRLTFGNYNPESYEVTYKVAGTNETGSFLVAAATETEGKLKSKDYKKQSTVFITSTQTTEGRVDATYNNGYGDDTIIRRAQGRLCDEPSDQ